MSVDDLFYRNSLIPRLTPIACALCVIVFLGLKMGGDDMTWQQRALWGYFPPSSVWEGPPWALVTHAFVHLKLWHIAFNVYWLWLLGNILEDEIGPLKWLAFFVVAAWVSSAYELLASGHIGIGMSGVGYALFGFGWVARRKMPSFKAILNQPTINIFLIWLVVCIFLTYTGAMNVANMAHFAGMIFGIAVAGVFVERWRLPLSAPGLGVLVLASFTPLVWCPLSMSWTTQKALYEDQAGRYEAAVYWYEQSLKRGKNPAWVWSQIADLHDKHHNEAGYEHAMQELKRFDIKAKAVK